MEDDVAGVNGMAWGLRSTATGRRQPCSPLVKVTLDMALLTVGGAARCRAMTEMSNNHHENVLYMSAPSLDDSVKSSTLIPGLLAVYVDCSQDLCCAA